TGRAWLLRHLAAAVAALARLAADRDAREPLTLARALADRALNHRRAGRVARAAAGSAGPGGGQREHTLTAVERLLQRNLDLVLAVLAAARAAPGGAAEEAPEEVPQVVAAHVEVELVPTRRVREAAALRVAGKGEALALDRVVAAPLLRVAQH